MWRLQTGDQKQLLASQGRNRRNALRKSKCSNTSGGCWNRRIMTGQRSSETSGRRGRCGGGLGRCYRGKGQSYPYRKILSRRIRGGAVVWADMWVLLAQMAQRLEGVHVGFL